MRPYIPGSVDNASTWSVPPSHKSVPGLNFAHLLGPEDKVVEAAVIQAAIELEREGARLITSNCGFMLRYQEQIRQAVNIPVLLSSLLLAPLLETMLPPGKALGIITANGAALTADLLAKAGTSLSPRIVISGLEGQCAFSAAFLTSSGELDIEAVESETVGVATALLAERPDVGMLLLECTELPPMRRLFSRRLAFPVFDFTSIVEFFVGSINRKPFTGVY
jgi:aspartate/glutamate racemase